MEQRKSQCIREMKVDRLSNLPDHIIEHILLRLSIKDAVRTSTLSSKWKHKWATLSSLVFDDHSFPVSVSSDELVNLIDHVLLLHRGPILKFKLSPKEPLPFRNIDRWIVYLSGTSINGFYLGFPNILGYTIPSCLFSCQDLAHLWLSKCSLRLPSTFKGFVNLKSLSLDYVTLAEDACEKLISSCHVLETLCLGFIFGVSHLNIVAPNLKFITLGYRFSDITFKDTPSLRTIAIYHLTQVNSMNLLERLANSPHIQKLDLSGNFITSLNNSGSPSPRVPPKFCDNLSTLSVDADFSSKDNVSRTIYVLQGIPNLQELNIRLIVVLNVADPSIWEEVGHGNCSFIKLLRIKISGLKGVANEMDFIKYMLSTSPVLERMVIAPLNHCDDKLVKELLRFERASAKAQIVLLDS